MSWRGLLRVMAVPGGVLLGLAGLWASLFALLTGGYAFEEPNPFILNGDPGCGHPDTYGEVALGFVRLAVAFALVGVVLALGLRSVRWGLSGRGAPWRRVWRLPAGFVVPAVGVALVAQVVQRDTAVTLPGCDEARAPSFVSGPPISRPPADDLGSGAAETCGGLTCSQRVKAPHVCGTLPAVHRDTRAMTKAWWGWGLEEKRIDPAGLGETVQATLGFGADEPEASVRLEDVALPAPRIDSPYSTDARDRILHAHGASYRDTVRAFRGRIDHPPDAVAHPRSEAEVEETLAWADGANVAVVPYGGGTSVVGGVECPLPPGREGVLSLDLGGLDRLLEVDPVSRSARIQAGLPGPALEAQLAEHGMTMRFFPQSFELSTLGGWIATRAGGHFATLWTHVDDLVESVRAITPIGTWESRRLPGSGAGVSPDRMLLGSEGTLGVITEAWVRVQPKPTHRAGRTVRFADFLAGAEAVREISQSGLHPANCRLVDAAEAQQSGAGDGTSALLVLGFESTDHEVDTKLSRALAITAAHGGEADPPRGGAASSWKDAFIALPYLRDALVQWGVLCETFETAITWERWPAFHAAVMGATREAVGEPCRVTCRFTHVYPNGPAPYYTVLVPARRGEELEQWDAVKRAAGQAIVDAGGTITHHHAVGRDHRPFYDQQRPDVFAAALRGAKAAVDPRGLLNPGVLI